MKCQIKLFALQGACALLFSFSLSCGSSDFLLCSSVLILPFLCFFRRANFRLFQVADLSFLGIEQISQEIVLFFLQHVKLGLSICRDVSGMWHESSWASHVIPENTDTAYASFLHVAPWGLQSCSLSKGIPCWKNPKQSWLWWLAFVKAASLTRQHCMLPRTGGANLHWTKHLLAYSLWEIERDVSISKGFWNSFTASRYWEFSWPVLLIWERGENYLLFHLLRTKLPVQFFYELFGTTMGR